MVSIAEPLPSSEGRDAAKTSRFHRPQFFSVAIALAADTAKEGCLQAGWLHSHWTDTRGRGSARPCPTHAGLVHHPLLGLTKKVGPFLFKKRPDISFVLRTN